MDLDPDTLPSTAEEMIEAIENASDLEFDLTEWGALLGALTSCIVCSKLLIPPDRFAASAVRHYKIPSEDDGDYFNRIKAALINSSVETGGADDDRTCADHSARKFKD